MTYSPMITFAKGSERRSIADDILLLIFFFLITYSAAHLILYGIPELMEYISRTYKGMTPIILSFVFFPLGLLFGGIGIRISLMARRKSKEKIIGFILIFIGALMLLYTFTIVIVLLWRGFEDVIRRILPMLLQYILKIVRL